MDKITDPITDMARKLVEEGVLPEELIALGTAIAEFLSEPQKRGFRFSLNIEHDGASMSVSNEQRNGRHGNIELRLSPEGWLVVALDHGKSNYFGGWERYA